MTVPADTSEKPIDAVIARIRAIYGGWTRETPIEQRRRDWEALLTGSDDAVPGDEVLANGVPCRWIVPGGGKPDAVILYFHGGGYQLGSVRSHAGLIGRIARASGCRALGVDYRLAPEHLFPSALHDGLTAYRWLLDQGVAPGRIAVVGDSAGGNLALAALISLRDAGLPLPAAAALLSPWTDLAATGESYVTRAQSDPIHQRAMILAIARAYLGRGGDADDPLASPLRADLSGLPPMLIQVGDRETVLDDSRLLAKTARKAGVEVSLRVWNGMIHVFQLFAQELPEAREAIAAIGRFLADRLATRPLESRPEPDPPG